MAAQMRAWDWAGARGSATAALAPSCLPPLTGYAGMRDVMTMTTAQDERPVIPGPSALPPASQDRHRQHVAPAARERTM